MIISIDKLFLFIYYCTCYYFIRYGIIGVVLINYELIPKRRDGAKIEPLSHHPYNAIILQLIASGIIIILSSPFLI